MRARRDYDLHPCRSPLRGRRRYAPTFKFARQLLPALLYRLLPCNRPNKFVELWSSSQNPDTQINKPPDGGLFIWRARKDESGHWTEVIKIVA